MPTPSINSSPTILAADATPQQEVHRSDGFAQQLQQVVGAEPNHEVRHADSNDATARNAKPDTEKDAKSDVHDQQREHHDFSDQGSSDQAIGRVAEKPAEQEAEANNDGTADTVEILVALADTATPSTNDIAVDAKPSDEFSGDGSRSAELAQAVPGSSAYAARPVANFQADHSKATDTGNFEQSDTLVQTDASATAVEARQPNVPHVADGQPANSKLTATTSADDKQAGSKIEPASRPPQNLSAEFDSTSADRPNPQIAPDAARPKQLDDDDALPKTTTRKPERTVAERVGAAEETPLPKLQEPNTTNQELVSTSEHAEPPSDESLAPLREKPTSTNPNFQSLLDRSSASSAPRSERSEQVDTAGPRVDVSRFVARVTRAFDAAEQRGGAVQLRLSPPELGAMRIELSIQQGTMTAKLETETAAAKNLLLDNLPALRDRLATQEIRVDKFDVDVQQQDSGGEPDWQARQEQREARQQNSGARLPAPSGTTSSNSDGTHRSTGVANHDGQFSAVA